MEPHRTQTARIARSEGQKWEAVQVEVKVDIGRYATYIDTSYRREEWSYEEEQRMVDYHNELGNKWAVIGNKLGGKYSMPYIRTDNSVKNHFYALLRKALRKINRVIQLHHKREFKQFSPTVLYRIVEVTEERFKLFPNY